MSQAKYIRQFTGWVLLLLFTFSITPRQLLHDVVADHTDLSIKPGGGKQAVVSKTGFTCDRLNQVAESPFAATEAYTENIPLQHFTELIVFYGQRNIHAPVVLPSLRGPPCI